MGTKSPGTVLSHTRTATCDEQFWYIPGLFDIISSHNLYIETGRWQHPKIPPEDRICPSCKNGVEDELHVFVQCQRYNDLRVPFFHKLKYVT